MLFVFDLDFTLWDCDGTWCDHTQPPYCKKEEIVVDARNRIIEIYPDIRFILELLQHQNVTMAVASRTSQPTWAADLLNLFEIEHFFSYKEIYPGSKIQHFMKLHKTTGIPYSEMYFFDDELRNIEEVGSLGVQCVWIEDGLQKSHLLDALAKASRPESSNVPVTSFV